MSAVSASVPVQSHNSLSDNMLSKLSDTRTLEYVCVVPGLARLSMECKSGVLVYRWCISGVSVVYQQVNLFKVVY